jgi:hypothetical protein
MQHQNVTHVAMNGITINTYSHCNWIITILKWYECNQVVRRCLNWKEITFCRSGWMDGCMLHITQNNMNSLYTMFMRSWAISNVMNL